MIIIRPTASLAKRMRVKLLGNDVTSTAQLGDWYANDIVLNRKQFTLCASSTSRLAVILDAAPYATFPDRLSDAVLKIFEQEPARQELLKSVTQIRPKLHLVK